MCAGKSQKVQHTSWMAERCGRCSWELFPPVVDDYPGFEQALYDEISTRKMDEEARKANSSINAVCSNTTEEIPREHGNRKRHEHEEENETVQIWSEEWQCHGNLRNRSLHRVGRKEARQQRTRSPR